MRRFDLKLAAISLSICAVIALIVSRFSRLPFVAAFLIVVGAMLLNGLIATYEDDMPGGFNNPDGKSTPHYVASLNRFAYWTLLVATICLAASERCVDHAAPLTSGAISWMPWERGRGRVHVRTKDRFEMVRPA